MAAGRLPCRIDPPRCAALAASRQETAVKTPVFRSLYPARADSSAGAPGASTEGGSDRGTPSSSSRRFDLRRPWSRGSGRSRRRARPARGPPAGPSASAAARSSALPPPPDAITGTETRPRPRAAARGRSRARAVAVHAREQDLAGPGLRHARRPLDGVDARSGRRPPCVQTSQPPAAALRRRQSIATTRFALPIFTAASPTRSGFSTAAVMIETLSAPAFRRSRTSWSERTPPPTVSGMNTLSAVRETTSSRMRRPSWLALMSRKVISSASCAS